MKDTGGTTSSQVIKEITVIFSAFPTYQDKKILGLMQSHALFFYEYNEMQTNIFYRVAMLKWTIKFNHLGYSNIPRKAKILLTLNHYFRDVNKQVDVRYTGLFLAFVEGRLSKGFP